MGYRPYPNADRALHQLDRHYPAAPEAPVLECLRPMAESFDRLRENAARVVNIKPVRSGLLIGGRPWDVEPPVDEYRMSTR
jgi:hypothetical protein